MRTPALRLIGTADAASAGGIPVDSKLLMEPNLRVVGRKPIGNVEIDWSNPITRGLVGCWILQGYQNIAYNLVSGVNGYLVLPANIEVKPHLEGIGARVTADFTQTRIHLQSVTSADRLSGVPTGIISTYVFANQGNATLSGQDFPRFIDKDYADGWAFYPNFSSGTKLSFSISNAGAVSTDISAYDDLDTGYGATALENSQGNNVRFFINGDYLSNATANANNFGTLTKDIALLNRSNVSDRQNLAPLYCAFVWDRALTDNEHASIHADRYQFLKPAGMVSDLSFIGTAQEEAEAEYYRMMAWF
jgi:hypothetical protein